MSKSPEQINDGVPSLAEENRAEYKHLFELQERSTNPAVQDYFKKKIEEVVTSAKEQMENIHGEGLVDKPKIDSFVNKANAELEVFQGKDKDLHNMQETLEKIWREADEFGLEKQKKEIAEILIRRELYPKHTTYWNDRFFFAHASGLTQKERSGDGTRENVKGLATRVIRNGMYQYFEQVTHLGLPLAELLKKDGILNDEDIIDKTGYANLSSGAIKRLAERYEISEEEIEGIALHLCMASLSKFKTREGEGIYDLDAGAGWLNTNEHVEQIANNYLKPDLAKVIINRIQNTSISYKQK